MTGKRTWIAMLSLACLLTASSCGGSPEPAAQEAEHDHDRGTQTARSGGARTLPFPGASPAQPQAQMRGSGPLVWQLPQGWEEVPPASDMRQAQFRIPGDGDDGECVVFYFGPGQGGDSMANASRWAGQFIQPDGSSSQEAMQLQTLTGGAFPLLLVEVTGTYDGGMTMTAQPAEARSNYMLLGGIAETGNGPWFFKFTGPESLLREQRGAFVSMLESLRLGA